MTDNILGPWEAAQDEPTIYAADGNQVAQVFPCDFDQDETGGLPERMTLIAAAPEMLAALKRADSLLTELRAYDLDDIEVIETLSMIDAVIGKAENFQPDEQAVQS